MSRAYRHNAMYGYGSIQQAGGAGKICGLTEVSPDVVFYNGSGATNNQWACSGDASMGGGQATLSAVNYGGAIEANTTRTGIAAGDSVLVTVDIASINASDSLEVYQIDGLGSILATWSTAGIQSATVVSGTGGISLWKSGANATCVLNSCSLKT